MANASNLDLIVEHPAGAAVVRAYLSGDPSVVPFYRGRFSETSAYRAKAEEVDGRFDRAARERAVEAVLVPPGADPSRLERFVEEGGYMVTTGQQPALFGGPLYSVYKALTAARLAEALEDRLGRPVLPLFWVASDDHDWSEANHVDVLDVANELHRLELAPPDPDVTPPMHRIPLGPEVTGLVDRFLQFLPQTDFSSSYLELIRDAFRPEATMPEAFHDTLQRLLGRFGVYFTDAAHPVLKRASGELLLAELDRAEELEGILGRTAESLVAGGFGLQVPIFENGVNLFLEGPAGRERLYRDGDGFTRHTSGTAVSRSDVERAFHDDPLVLSPNVLLRPVVESAVFPTLSYVAGPGEVAYFAQLDAYFRAHEIAMPVVYPRWAATPVERKVGKVLEKFGVSVDELRRPFHEIAGDVARDEVPDEVRSAIGKLRGAVGTSAGELQALTGPIDATLKGPVQHMRSQAFAAIDDLEKKIVTAVKRETDIALSQLEKAQVHLFPRGKPVERVQTPFYFLTRYGEAFLDSLHDRFAVKLD